MSRPIASSTSPLEKMFKNTGKALIEHTARPLSLNFVWRPVYERGSKRIEELKEGKPVKVVMESHAAQGPREQMEDFHFYETVSGGVFAGVFDGHGEGKEVAEFACAQIRKILQQADREDMRQTFQGAINAVQEEVKKKSEWESRGTTAVLVFVDAEKGLIYTATLGDSEAKLYRQKAAVIPLSCVRHWASAKDAQRATEACPQIMRIWVRAFNNPKARFFPRITRDVFTNQPVGLNVARAIGDVAFRGLNGVAAVSQKAKVTVERVCPGDVVVLASDGLWDYVGETMIMRDLSAKGLVELALRMQAADNVTVVALKIEEGASSHS